MKILVTGSAGFIGYHLCAALLSRGHDLLGVDNFNLYYDAGLKQKRHDLLRGMRTAGSFKFKELDVCQVDELQSVFDAFQPSVVVHLAAHPGARHSQKAPFDYIRNNCEGFVSVLECCRKQGVPPRLIFASSSSVYGRNIEMPFKESHAVGAPLSLYAATKSANELMAHVYADHYGLQCIGLRFFTVYGPWYRPDMALSLFANAMLEGRPLPLFNSGELRRDLTYVDDVVDGIIRCLTCDSLDTYEILNIGRSRAEKLIDIVEILALALGVKPKFDFLPMQAGDMKATWADISKIASKTGYAPKTSISEGIPRFATWYQGYYH